MPDFTLTAGMRLSPTPAGAYAATVSPEESPARHLLLALLGYDETPALTEEAVCRWSGIEDPQAALAVLHRLQSLAMIQVETEPRQAPAQTISELLPPLLARLTRSGKMLLSDAQGFYLAASGFDHDVAEELSALSADLASLHERHQRLLARGLGLGNSSWALVDAAGNSQLGVWPLFVGHQRFALVATGTPRFNQPVFVELIWALARRYAAMGSTAGG